MDDHAFPRSRPVAVGTVVLAALVGLVAVLMSMLAQAIQCFDGDGGSPYVARDSRMGSACRLGAGVPLLSLPVVAGGVGVLAAVIVVRRWMRAEIGAVWLLLALVAPAAVPVGTVLGVYWSVPAACTGDDAEAYAAWLASGADGPPPADCDAY